MSASRQPPPRAPSSSTVGGRSRSGPEPTESLAPGDDDWDGAPPELPMGTRDERPRSINTRIDSPAAKVRTPATRPPPVPRAADRSDERVGQTLGVYRLLELIGKGGMGFVYRAEHVRLGREVALKLLRTDYAKRRDAVSRFFQEARTVNRVRHRNIVDVTDFIELEDGTTFIIMELLRGKSLGAWSRNGFELPRALAALIQICDGLAAAHAVGVIHRDLKPDNIVLVPTPDGAELVKLLDFGVAKLLNRDDEDIGLETAAGSVIGTPAYMSPEQAGGLAVDHRADIYSLGAIMYELFCGQPLFRGRSFGEYVRKHLNEQPTPPRETPGGATLDPRLEGVLLRCLQKDPGLRYPTAQALRDDLMHLLAAIETRPHDLIGLADSARESGRSSNIMPVAGYATMMAMGGGLAPGQATPYPGPGAWTQPPPPRRSRWLWAAGAAAALGAIVAGGLIAASRSSSTPPPAAPAPAPVASAPAVTPMTGQAPTTRVRVRVDAPAGAHVEAAGAAVALCDTPCVLEIDPADGGSTVRRDFVVRQDGFVDAPFTIDLGKPPPSVEISLEQIIMPDPTPIEVDPPGEATSGRRDGRRDRPRETGREPAKVTPPPPPPPVDPGPGSAAPTGGSGAGSGSAKKPKDTKVDPTVTIDPFAGGG
ncbi:MAG: serine/threonine protein kinase [Myxococcales bacterium]|nr:serine/threonine protein kinase [Myxococcales bacterium]